MDTTDNTPQPSDPSSARKKICLLALGALGIVYGDIGTSPLYAFRECFASTHGIPVTTENILGIL
ncbi:MAG: KUP/HAK/KT family potassium transporter, partial [Victivallales bacterium]